MALEASVHGAQTAILRELLFHPSSNYAAMQKATGLASDHFNFHIQKLIDAGHVEKLGRGKYGLSPRGKEYANKLDTDSDTIERQPKAAVILAIEREDKGRRLFLFQERLKHPYYGFWGFPTGKIRWGETILETASRELMEETGLVCERRIAGVYHEMVYKQETGEQLEDKIFFVVHCTQVAGEMIEGFEGGRNAWMAREEALGQPKIFTSFDIEIGLIDAPTGGAFIERRVEYTKDLF